MIYHIMVNSASAFDASTQIVSSNESDSHKEEAVGQLPDCGFTANACNSYVVNKQSTDYSVWDVLKISRSIDLLANPNGSVTIKKGVELTTILELHSMLQQKQGKI